jgi:uncharacterized protein YecE (DUF72 family)
MPASETRIGTSGFSYPGKPPAGWYGAFYPERKTKGFDELKYFSQIFNTCEINQTFYRPPSAKITGAWAAKTPDDFKFAIKLWQKFTHPKKISRKKSEEAWEPPQQKDFDEFRAGILPLADAGKLGALLLQYPTGFHYSPESLEELEKILKRFYDYPKVVELRHQSWSENRDDIASLLQEYRASEVLIDEPKFKTSIRQQPEAIGMSSTFARMAATQRHGGMPKNHGKDTTTCTPAKRSSNTRRRSKRPRATHPSRPSLGFTTITRGPMPRRMP